MTGLFESLTIYVMLGLLLGLLAFTLLWRKWDVPAYFKERFKLKTRAKCVIFIVVFGVLLALCLAMVLDVAGLPPAITQLLEGLAIGFNCSLIPGLLRPKDGYGRAGSAAQAGSRNTNKRAAPSKTRRSKG